MFGWNYYSMDHTKKLIIDVTVNHEKYTSPFIIKFKNEGNFYEETVIALNKEEMESLQFHINAAVNEYDLGEVEVEVSPI